MNAKATKIIYENKVPRIIQSLGALERRIGLQKDPRARIETRRLFEDIRGELKYRNPTKPIDIQNDGNCFTCPTCGVMFKGDDGATWDEFDLCHNCGQLFKSQGTMRQDLDERDFCKNPRLDKKKGAKKGKKK